MERPRKATHLPLESNNNPVSMSSYAACDCHPSSAAVTPPNYVPRMACLARKNSAVPGGPRAPHGNACGISLSV